MPPAAAIFTLFSALAASFRRALQNQIGNSAINGVVAEDPYNLFVDRAVPEKKTAFLF